MESSHFFACLSNLNSSKFNAIELLKTKAKEIKEDIIEEVPENFDSDDSRYEEMKKKQKENKKHGDQNFYQRGSKENKAEKILKGVLSDISNVLESSGFLDSIHRVYVLAKDLYLMSLNMLYLH